MRRAIVIAVALIMLAALLGWLRAATFTAAGTVGADEWASLQKQGADPAKLPQLAAQIRGTNLFLLSRREQSALDQGVVDASLVVEVNAAPPFPTILAASAPNGTWSVIVMDGAGERQSARSGDTLISGWLIKSVDRRQVIAVFDGEESRFPIAEYLDTAFDVPEGEGVPELGPDTGGEN